MGLFAALLPDAGAGQSLAPYRLSGTSDNSEILDSRGWGAAFKVPLSSWAQLKVSVDQRTGTGVERFGRVCVLPTRLLACSNEDIDSSTRMSALTVALMPIWRPIPFLQLSGGGGLTVAHTRLDATGRVSGKFATIANPNTAHPGAALVLEVSLIPLPSLDLALFAGWQRRELMMEGCDSSGVLHESFCGWQAFDDVQIGAVIPLAWRR